MKVYPSILLHAEANRQPTTGYRVWHLARGWEQGGTGYVPRKEFRQYLKSLGLAKSTYSRWIRQAYSLGLFQKAGKGKIKLAGLQTASELAGCPEVERPALIELDKFIGEGWLSFVWACFIGNHQGIIARATLGRLSGGVPKQTQIYREHKAGVKNQANYANLGKVKDNPDKAINAYGEPGHYSKSGDIRRQLPNSRTVPECVQQANKGKTKTVNRALAESFSDKASSRVRGYRLYSDSAKQTKRIRRQDKKLDDLSRPSTIFELSSHKTDYKTRKQIGVYYAITL